MSFVYTFAKLIKIKDNSFINSMKSFKGLAHRFEIFLKEIILLLLTIPRQLRSELLNLLYLVLKIFIGY